MIYQHKSFAKNYDKCHLNRSRYINANFISHVFSAYLNCSLLYLMRFRVVMFSNEIGLRTMQPFLCHSKNIGTRNDHVVPIQLSIDGS